MATIAHNTSAARSFSQFSVAPLTPGIGAELHGIDLGSDLSDDTIAEIRAAK